MQLPPELPVGIPGDWGSMTTLAQVLEYLGIRALDIVAAPRGLQVPAGETVLLGIGEPVEPSTDGILLAAGARAALPETVRTIRDAGRAGYCAVVVKSFSESLAPLAREASAAGIALLSTPDEMPWRHLDALLNAATPAIGPALDRLSSVGIGDLFSLANAIAGAVGGATTIEDPAGQVLAYSNLPNQEIDEIRSHSILGRQTPDRPTNREEYQAVFGHTGPLSFESAGPGHYARTAIGLWAGKRPIGIIWVITDHPQLAPDALQTLADSAKVAELHLLRMRGNRDPDRWRRTETLRLALLGQADPATLRSDLGLDVDDLCTLLAIAPSSLVPAAPTVPARIIDLVTLLCDSWDPRALCVAADDVVYALMPLGLDPTVIQEQQARVHKLALEIVATAGRAANLSLVIGIGPVALNPLGIPQTRQDADRVLQILRADRRQPAVGTVADVQAAVTLLALADQGAGAPASLIPLVKDLLATDSSGGTPYAETLLAYLGTMGDIGRTALTLNLHENTVRYRVRRAQELFKIDFTTPDEVLILWLQLRLALGERLPR